MSDKKTKRFEDLEVWLLASELAEEVYRLSKLSPMRRDYGFIDQIRRAAISVMNNISEGHERSSKKEFVQFLFVAKGSAGEVRSMLHIANKLNYIDQTQYKQAEASAIRCSQMLWGLIKHVEKRPEWRTRI